MVETALGQSLLVSLGSPLVFFTRHISEVFITLALISIGWGIWLQVRYKAPGVAVEADY